MEPFGAFFGTKFTPYLEALRTHADKRYISVIIIIIINREIMYKGCAVADPGESLFKLYSQRPAML